ncbi:MAG: TatD family hydrolase, partial [Antricoccus sp.]
MTQDRSHGRQGDPPPAPEPLPYPVVDSHTHLDLVIDTVGGSVADQVAAAAEVGVDRLVQVGVDLTTSRWSVAAAVANPAVVAAVALHPNDAPLMTEQELDAALGEIDQLAAHGRVRAIGETGLDFFRTTDAAQLAQQERSFRAHIQIAKKHQLPVMIHDRDAHEDVFRVLADEGAPEQVVFHCFSGDTHMARYCSERGYYISFAGNCTFAKAQQLR